MTALLETLPPRDRTPARGDSAKPVVVLGGGPCGLAAADALARAGRPVVLLEEQPFIGGAAASVRFGDFTCDFGPHAYHVKGDRVDQLVRESAAEALEEKDINQKLVIGDKLLTYPLVLWEVIRHLHPLFVLRAAFDFILANITYKLFRVPDDSFERWGVKRFGFTLYHLCFGQYTQRVWGVHPTQISPKLARQKLHKLNLLDLVWKLLGGSGQEQATYWRKFYYPDAGIGTVWEGFRLRIERHGGRVVTGAEVIALERDAGEITAIRYRTGGGDVRLPCSAVISTIPVGRMAAALAPALDESVVIAARDMKYRSLIVVNLVFDTPKILDQHWIYLLDPRFRYNRISEQKNLGRLCSPSDKSVLAFELTCDMEDGVWFASDEVLKQRTLAEAAKFPGLPLDRCVGCHVQRMKRAYPMYDLDFDRRLKLIFDGLGGIENLWSTGRHGLFLNTDMHDTLEMGLAAAENLLADAPLPPAAYYDRSAGYAARKMSAVKT